MNTLNQFIPLITNILSKEDNLHFIAGLIIGLIIGGLVATYIVPKIWTPK